MSVPLKKNDDITLEITGMNSEGAGVGRADGFAVFVPFALPGETVEAHIIKSSSSYAVAKLTKVVSPSPDRVEPLCPLFSKCGGCALMHMSYPAQLAYKRRLVKDALERIGGLGEVEVSPVIGMDDPFRSRNKGSFPFGVTEDGRPVWGLFAPRSHRLIPAEDCLIENEDAVKAANAVLKWALECSVPIYDESSGTGILRHVETRSLTGGAAVAVVTTGRLPNRDRLIEIIREALPDVRSIVHNVNPRATNVICGDKDILLWGDETVFQEIRGMRFGVSRASFLQVNTEQTEKLYSLAVDGLGLTKDMTAADVFCGIGTMTLMLADKAKEAVGIEYVEKAVRDAEKNSVLNGIGSAEFFAGPAEEVLPKLVREGRRFDCIVLDPPRKGADRRVLEAIIDSGAERVAYVSCSPATLARDLALLVKAGYNVKSVTPVDMFPMTAHIETVVLMIRA